MSLTIDKTELETLSSGTRRKILKSLRNHGKTPTYLSEELRKSKSTVVEHLSKLVVEGFVEREEKEGRKRVIYSLTPRGEKLVGPGRGISVTLIASVLSLVGGFAALWRWLSSPQYVGARMAQEATKAPGETATAPQPPSIPWILIAGVILFVLGSAGLIYWARKR